MTQEQTGKNNVRQTQIIELRSNRAEIRLPYFTAAGWLMVMLVGLACGMIGAGIYAYILSPFCK